MKKVYLFVIITAFCFGTLEIAGKIAGKNIDAFQLTFWRFIIGALCLLPMAIKEYKDNSPQITGKDIFHVICAGILCVPVSLLICQLGIERCNAATASVILASNGLFTIVFAYFIAKEEFTSRKITALLIALFGLIFLIKPWDLQEGNTVLGVTLMLIGAVTFALYVVIGKMIGQKTGVIVQACGCMFSGAIALLIVILFMGKPVIYNLMPNIAVVLYNGIVVTGGGYMFLFLAIKYSNASTGAVAFFLKIAIAPILSMIILNETILWNGWVGILLILIASFTNMSHSRAKGNRSAIE